MKYKLIAFDLVGTLTEQDALYRKIHELKNCKDKAKQNVQFYLERKISEKELINRNVSYHKGIPIEIMKIEAKKLEFRPGTEELINKLKEKYVLALITSDYDIAAQFVKINLVSNTHLAARKNLIMEDLKNAQKLLMEKQN